MASRRFFASAEKRPKRQARVRERSIPSTFFVDPDAQTCQAVAVQRVLLTVTEVRSLLNLRTNAAVYWHIEHSGLPVRRIGRAIRVDQAELDEWTRRDRQDEPRRLVMVRGA